MVSYKLWPSILFPFLAAVFQQFSDTVVRLISLVRCVVLVSGQLNEPLFFFLLFMSYIITSTYYRHRPPYVCMMGPVSRTSASRIHCDVDALVNFTPRRTLSFCAHKIQNHVLTVNTTLYRRQHISQKHSLVTTNTDHI